MFIKINTSVMGPVAVIVRDQTKQRLAGTCFRGFPTERAGNFHIVWNDVHDVLNCDFIKEKLLISAHESLKEKRWSDSLHIDCENVIGWSGTDDLGKYKPEDLEPFNPNRRSTALRVRISRTDLLAPQTNFVTLVYEVRPEGHQTAIIVHSMYPGKDIGELNANITEREKIVFFDWGHPGVPLENP